jgi:hypothetical protein
MNIPIYEPVVAAVLKLQAIEEGRCGNYINIDQRVNTLRYLVSDLVMASVLREIRKQQSKPKIER